MTHKETLTLEIDVPDGMTIDHDAIVTCAMVTFSRTAGSHHYADYVHVPFKKAEPQYREPVMPGDWGKEIEVREDYDDESLWLGPFLIWAVVFWGAVIFLIWRALG